MEIAAYKPPIRSSLVLRCVLITGLAGFSSARLWAQKGPSFDCAKASTVVENTICANPSLAAMDQKLSSTYKAELALLSEDGRASLRDGQRQWVKVVRLVCDTTVLPDAIFKDKIAPAPCIENKYRDRQKQLEEAVTTYGNIKIHRVDIFSALRSPLADDNTGADRGFVTLNVSYPQIDHPKSDSEMAWNKKMKSLTPSSDLSGGCYSEEGPGSTDAYFRYEILSVSEKLISVEISSGFYAHGAVHGQYDRSVVNWLVPSGRELKPEDIFDEKTSWKDALTNYCFHELSGRKGYGYWVKKPEDLGEMPTQPERWVLGEGGLTIQFDPYEVASYADGAPEVLVPWSELKQYLLSTAPITLPVSH